MNEYNISINTLTIHQKILNKKSEKIQHTELITYRLFTISFLKEIYYVQSFSY